MDEKELILYKLIFLGARYVGKSSILDRFKNDSFYEDCQATIGLNFKSKKIEINNQFITLLLYDTSGQEKYKSLLPMYLKDIDIYFLIYDISNRNSFINLSEWINIITPYKNKNEFIVFLIGNKIDKEGKREVTNEKGSNFAKEHNYIFQEISAKTNEGFNKLFYIKLCEEMRKKFNIEELEEE